MAEVKREHREAALLAHHWSRPWGAGVVAWVQAGGDTLTEPDGYTWNFVEENATAKAIADAEQRGRSASIDVLRRHCKFYRDRQAALEKLGRAGDVSARGQAYECELRANDIQELIDECVERSGG